jgi:hypothetical protein
MEEFLNPQRQFNTSINGFQSYDYFQNTGTASMIHRQKMAEFTVDIVRGIDGSQQACLTEIFCIATNSIKLTLASEAFFYVAKFDLAQTGNCEDFELFISQVQTGDRLLWREKFESGVDKWLVLIEQ